MRLRTKYAIVLLALMFVLGSVLFVSTEQFKRQLVDQERQEVERTANLTADQIDEALVNRVDYVSWFAGESRTSENVTDEENLRSFVDGGTKDVYAVQVLDPNGTIIAFEGDINETQANEAIGKNVSDRELVKQLQVPERSTVISAPERDASRNLTTVKIGTKVIGTNETTVVNETTGETETVVETEVQAYLVGAFELGVSNIFDAKEPLETGTQTVEITGVDDTGTAILLDEPDGTFDQTIASTATIDSTGWELTVRRDRSQLTQRLGTLRAVQGVGLAMVFLSFVLLGVWEYRTNLRQTEELLDGFAALEDGEYDHEVDLEAAEEWRQMSDGFNQLASGLERREEQIREREQQLSVVNRVLRHNLKNEMTVIQGHAEMLPMLDSRERREETLETISETAKRLLSHSQKARHIDSAIESAKEGRKAVDCTHVVEKVCESIAGDYPEVDLEREVPEDTEVYAISAFEYAVQSIVENAFEHNDSDDPWVRVWTETSDGTVELSVADNGPGIPAHEIEVLERGTETGLEHGSGVGLWLAFWIVKRSEGTLRFTRREPTGTVVTIALPAAEG